jgi:hypothetical protein
MSRNLTKSLSPMGGGVSHHWYIHSLVITEVFGKCDTSVDGCLTGSYMHVGCVGNKGGMLHDTNFTLFLGDFILESHGELREITKYFRHLVTTFSASYVNNGIGVGEFGKGLGVNSLSATKGSWNGTSSSEYRWEEIINDTKTSNEGLVSRKLLCNWTWAMHWPEVAEG